MYDKLGRTQGQNLILKSSLQSDIESESNHIQQTQKMYDYYKNDRSAIIYHLLNYLSGIYNEDTLANIKPVWINYVPRIIKRLALVYKNPAARYINSKNDDTNYLLYNRNLNKQAKEFHRQAKLLNTILVRPIFDKKRKIFDYTILSRRIADVETANGNDYEMTHLTYAIEVERNEKTETVNVHWDDESFYLTDENGKEIFIEGISNEGNKNPYGRIPFSILRLEEADEFWGDGLSDLVDANESLNARLTDMYFKLYMSFGIPFGVNLNIKQENFSLGPDKGIFVDNANIGEVAPDLKFVTPDHKTEFDKVINDWMVYQMGTSKGLPASAFSQNEIATSGYAKTIDNLELIDLNEDDKDALREFETDLFALQNKELEVNGIAPFKGEFKIEFAPIEFPKSDTEIWLNREKEYQFNISSPKDWLKEYRPNADDAELEKILNDVKEFKAKYDAQNTRKTALDYLQGTNVK